MRSTLLGLVGLGVTFAVACGGGEPEVRDGDGTAGGDPVGSTGGSAATGAGGAGVVIAGQGNGASANGGATAGNGTGAGSSTDPCLTRTCEEGEKCEVQDDVAVCVTQVCGDNLTCGAVEECVTVPSGAICESLACTSDVGCAEARFCDTTDGTCKDDTCVPFATSCDGGDVLECAANGSGTTTLAACASPTSFNSVCSDAGDGGAGCTCNDDWDCPGFQNCEGGICSGSVTEPTCRLEPADITTVLPAQEIVWGTAGASDEVGRLRVVDGADPMVTDSPWPAWVQATQTPVVANLDDDNGDGKIDERDVPEVLFLAFRDGSVNANGVLRAIHGGGFDADGNSKKGRDYLALCGTGRFLNGDFVDTDGAVTTDPGCSDGQADIDPASTIAVGDLDYDGRPEIVVYGENGDGDGFDQTDGYILIFDNRGTLLLKSREFRFDGAGNDSGENPGISLANVVPAASGENELVEIVIGRDLFTLSRTVEDDDTVTWGIGGRYQGGDTPGMNAQGPSSCVADIVPARPGMEIVAGGAVYGIPLTGGNELDTSGSDPTSNTASAALVQLGDAGRDGFCAIADMWGATTNALPGPGNPLDQKPEIVLVSGGDLYVYAIDDTDPNNLALTDLGALNSLDLELPGGSGGGAPNVDDFDGDGFPEVGTAGPAGYIVFDLQASTDGAADPDDDVCPSWTAFSDNQTSKPRTPPAAVTSCDADADCNPGVSDPSAFAFACNAAANVGNGACVCLHNSWRTLTQDDSSEVTGSSVFDFNGDGSAEVVYNDECHFRVLSGLDGTEYFLEPSESRTRIEYPIVADVDNDGNAEIVFATTTESGFCTQENQSLSCTSDADCPSGDQPNGQKCVGPDGGDGDNLMYCSLPSRDVFNAGIEVWGDPSDRWVSARRIWNQYSYHVTNVTEAGQIPRVEPDSWKPLGSRFYNTYRSQPRAFGVAPDLTVAAVQLSSPDAACGTLSQKLEISVALANIGDLRVGAGVQVAFRGAWGGTVELLQDENGDPLTYTIMNSLEPRERLIFQVPYEASFNGQSELPDSVEVIVDPASNVLNSGDTSQPDGAARECEEGNNTLTEDVEPGEALADLRLVLDDTAGDCPDPTISGEVFNDGAIAAPSGVVVNLYAGDPEVGGTLLTSVTIDEEIAAGASETFSATLSGFPVNAAIRVFGVADPENTVNECNDANNKAGPAAERTCVGSPVIQ